MHCDYIMLITWNGILLMTRRISWQGLEYYDIITGHDCFSTSHQRGHDRSNMECGSSKLKCSHQFQWPHIKQTRMELMQLQFGYFLHILMFNMPFRYIYFLRIWWCKQVPMPNFLTHIETYIVFKFFKRLYTYLIPLIRSSRPIRLQHLLSSV